MSNLTVLSDADLDAVSGGRIVVVAGNGGDGGVAVNGFAIGVRGGTSTGSASVSITTATVSGGTANANGGAGGMTRISFDF